MQLVSDFFSVITSLMYTVLCKFERLNAKVENIYAAAISDIM